MAHKARDKLPGVLRLAQVSLFLLFLADTYVYSILDTLLGRYLGTLGITQDSMSLAYAIYGMFQVAASVALLLLQAVPAVSDTPPSWQYILVLLVVTCALGSTLLMVLWPASYSLLLLARALQGTFGAIYSIYGMVLLARVFPSNWQMQAVAFMTAGQTFGDSLSPVLGAVLYDLSGIRSAYATQTGIYGVALVALLVLCFWWKAGGYRWPHYGAASPAASVPEDGASELVALSPRARAAAGDLPLVDARDEPSQNSGSAVVREDSGLSELPEPGMLAAAAGAGGKCPAARTADALRSVDGLLPPASLRLSSNDFTVQQPEGASADGNKSSSGATAASSAVIVVAFAPATAAGAAPVQSMTVWQMLRQWFVVCECMVAFFSQMLRAALDVLVPLAMYSTPTWLVGVVFLGEAAGAVLAPFALDQVLVWFPRTSTRRLQLAVVCCMAVAGPVVLLFHLSVPGALVSMFCFGAAHSMIEALVYKHLVDHVGSEEDPGVLNATMSAFSLFYCLGFTVGAFVAGAPRQDDVMQQQLALAAVAVAMLGYTLLHQWLLQRGCVRSRGSGS